MSQHNAEASASFDDSELQATATPGYQLSSAKTVAALAELDKDDEALNRWKQSLGISANASSGSGSAKPTVNVIGLSLTSAGLASPITLDVGNPAKLEALKTNPLQIKEGSEYAVEIQFIVSAAIVSGLKYIQVVKRKGITVDKTEQMVGSYGPAEEAVSKRFPTEEAPSGMLARGTYAVRSRVLDDDNAIHADFTWYFKIAKDW